MDGFRVRIRRSDYDVAVASHRPSIRDPANELFVHTARYVGLSSRPTHERMFAYNTDPAETLGGRYDPRVPPYFPYAGGFTDEHH